MKNLYVILLLLCILTSGCAKSITPLAPTIGAGTAWNLDGKLITNYHVIDPLLKGIENAKKNEIHIIYKGKIQKAEITDYDKEKDLCLLSVQNNSHIPPALPTRALLPEKDLAIGQHIYMIGYPSILNYGFSPKYIDGRISSLFRHKNGIKTNANSMDMFRIFIESGLYEHKSYPESLMITTIPAIGGASGSPVFSDDGVVIGMLSGAVNAKDILSVVGNVWHVSTVIPIYDIQAFRYKQRIPSSLLFEDDKNSSIKLEDRAALVVTVTPYATSNDKKSITHLLDRLRKSYDQPASK